MKIRYDFVTNSSSSSFILGEPGVISGKTKEDIMADIKRFCNLMIKFRDELDEKLKEHKQIFKEIQQVRNGTKYVDVALALEWSIRESKEYNIALRELYNKYKTDISNTSCGFKGCQELDYEQFERDIAYSYFSNLELDRLKNIEETLNGHIYDIKDTMEFGFGTFGWLLDWYEDSYEIKVEDSNERNFLLSHLEEEMYRNCGYIPSDWLRNVGVYTNNYKEVLELADTTSSDEFKQTIDYRKIFLKYLGEFCIIGFWEGDIPYLVVDYLMSISRLGCNHMG